MKNSVLTFFLLFFAGFFFASDGFALANYGYVAEIRGNWILNGGASLRQAQPLPASGVISIKSPGRFDYIKIADINGRVTFNQKCSRDCSFRLPAAPPKPSTFTTVWQTITGLLWSESPNNYSKHRSRGGVLSDGIVKIVEGKIDLSPLVKTGEQSFLQWRTIAPGAKEEEFGKWSEIIELKDENNIITGGFKPGLYEFSLLRKVGEEFEPQTSAWILVVSPENYEKTVKAFREVEEFNKSTGEDLKPETRQMFVKAYLDHLARGEEMK